MIINLFYCKIEFRYIYMCVYLCLYMYIYMYIYQSVYTRLGILLFLWTFTCSLQEVIWMIAFRGSENFDISIITVSTWDATLLGYKAPLNLNLRRFLTGLVITIIICNLCVFGFSQTFMIIIKPAWWVRKHETQSCSESCVFSFSSPILIKNKYSLIQVYKENDFFNKILQEKEKEIKFILINKMWKFSLFAWHRHEFSCSLCGFFISIES